MYSVQKCATLFTPPLRDLRMWRMLGATPALLQEALTDARGRGFHQLRS